MGDCCINHLLSNTMSLLSTVVSLDVENKRKNVDKERSTLPLLHPIAKIYDVYVEEMLYVSGEMPDRARR